MPSKKRLTRLTQALRDVRIIPRVRFRSWTEVKKGIRVHPNVADELERIAFEAYARAHKKAVADYDNNISIAVILAPIKAANAAAHFVSEKEFETTRPVFRRLIANTGKASLKRAAISLLEKMPRDGSPPFPQMRELASASEWRTKLNPAIVREMLGRWVELMNDLNSMTGSGRSPLTAETKFVGALAHYWKEELGAKIVNSRTISTTLPKTRSSHAYEQGGLFADFVRESAKIIPKTYRPSYWDQAIRKVIENKS